MSLVKYIQQKNGEWCNGSDSSDDSLSENYEKKVEYLEKQLQNMINQYNDLTKKNTQLLEKVHYLNQINHFHENEKKLLEKRLIKKFGFQIFGDKEIFS